MHDLLVYEHAVYELAVIYGAALLLLELYVIHIYAHDRAFDLRDLLYGLDRDVCQLLRSLLSGLPCYGCVGYLPEAGLIIDVNLPFDVVPSPTILSWVLATSTIIFAAGCSMCISSSMVAPSLVMTTSPRVSTSILSMPLGPSVVLTASATALAAAMVDLWASLPLLLNVPPGSIRMGCPPICANPAFTISFTSLGIKHERMP